jgi:GNAT superfamily N-acetyltransferase
MPVLAQEQEDLKALEAGWADLGVEIDAGISTDIYGRKNLHLSRIEVRKDLRDQGLGTRAMEDLVGLADHYGMLTTLSPSTDFGASSKERLKRFYRRFGFVSNKGRRKDFTLFDSMYRPPVGGP